MVSQFGAQGKLVDLNCGRYCAAAAINWYLINRGGRATADVFKALPEPTGQTVFKFDIAWNCRAEGSKFTNELPKPTSIDEWYAYLMACGPLVVSGKLGLADWGLLGGVDHYILIIGVDGSNLVYKDPLNGDTESLYDFGKAHERIKTVFSVSPEVILVDTFNNNLS